MKALLFGLGLLFVLSACQIAPPEIALNEVPAEPWIKKLTERRASFVGMKAVARVTIERKGRTRVYESVAVLEQGFRKLKVEGYGPLGETLFAFLWDGADVLVRKPGETEPLKVGQFGLEQITGLSIAPADLCAVLSGNVPALPSGALARAGCSSDARCVVDLRHDDVHWRIPVVPQAGDASGDVVVAGAELFRGNRPVLRSSFEPEGWSPNGGLPKRVTVEDPERKVRLVVDYEQADANVLVEDGLFTLTEGEEQGK